MRIGLFTDTYPPHINGVATSVCMLKKALEKMGHDVYLVTVNPDNMKFLYEDGGKTIRIPGLPVGIYDYRLTGIYPVRIINKIKKWKLDVIHSHTEFGVGTFARIISKQLNIPLVHTYHTMYEDYVHYITKGYFNRSSKKLVEYLTMFYCDTTANELIVPTKKTLDLFKEKYKMDKNIYIVPTGIEIERFYSETIDSKSVESIKKNLNIKKDDFVILFVGRLGKEKNLDFLIDCHKDLINDIPNLKFIIIGDGPERDEFENTVKKLKLEDSITFTGMIAWEEVPKYYQIADVFATASTTETQGLTVIEAMAAGVTPICIDDESFRMVIIDGLNGKIFKTKKSYKTIIKELHDNPSELNNLRKQARLNAELHSSRHYAESALNVYRHAIANKGGRFGLVSNIIKKITK